MSDTPRTDPYKGKWATYWHNGETVFDLAQRLEAKLKQAEAENQQQAKVLAKIAEGGFGDYLAGLAQEAIDA